MGSHEAFLEKKFGEASKFVQENSKVLDLGCNNGKLNDFLQKCEYYGVDIDKEMVSELTRKGIKAKKADLNKDEIPFKDKNFDYIIMLDVLEHLVNPAKLLSDSKEKLEKGGKMIITLPNDYHFLNKIRFLFNRSITADPFAPYGHLHFFSIKVGENFLNKQGFKILRKKSLAPPKPFFMPQFISEFLTLLFPQSFARDILYLLEPKD